MAQDDEIFFSLVPGMLPDFMAGIDVLEQNNWGIPMRHFLKEEVEMRPKYMDMAQSAWYGRKIRIRLSDHAKHWPSGRTRHPKGGKKMKKSALRVSYRYHGGPVCIRSSVCSAGGAENVYAQIPL